MNEWLKLMMDEIRRKQREQAEVLRERERRRSGSGDGASKDEVPSRLPDPPGGG